MLYECLNEKGIRVGFVHATDVGGGENYRTKKEPQNQELGEGMMNWRGPQNDQLGKGKVDWGDI